MEYARLSEQVHRLSNSQRSDLFVKRFRQAVRDGIFDAAEAPGRFELPKAFKRRGADETYARSSREMIVALTPEYEGWFSATDAELLQRARSQKAQPSVASFGSGELDFASHVEETRRKMQTRAVAGSQLGKSKKGTKKKKRSA